VCICTHSSAGDKHHNAQGCSLATSCWIHSALCGTAASARLKWLLVGSPAISAMHLFFAGAHKKSPESTLWLMMAFFIFGPALQYKLAAHTASQSHSSIFSAFFMRGLSALFDANCKLLCIVTSWRKRHCRACAIFHCSPGTFVFV
jgi:hypothetical protein